MGGTLKKYFTFSLELNFMRIRLKYTFILPNNELSCLIAGLFLIRIQHILKKLFSCDFAVNFKLSS